MITTLMILQVFICIFIIITVLLQFGKGSEAGLMSGGAGEAVFSSGQQGNILSKITTGLVIAFVINCLALSKLQSEKHSKSLLDGEAPVARPLNSDGEKVNDNGGNASPTNSAAPVTPSTDSTPVEAPAPTPSN